VLPSFATSGADNAVMENVVSTAESKLIHVVVYGYSGKVVLAEF
jgi:hypothetical protein